MFLQNKWPSSLVPQNPWEALDSSHRPETCPFLYTIVSENVMPVYSSSPVYSSPPQKMLHLLNPYSRSTTSLFSYLNRLGNTTGCLKYSDASAVRYVGQDIFRHGQESLIYTPEGWSSLVMEL